MDGNIINGGDVVRKILDFGDEFIRHLVEKNYVFYAFQSWHGLRLYVSMCWTNSRISSRNIFPMFQCSTIPVIKLIVNFCFLINVWHKMVLDKLDIFCLIISVFLYMLNYYYINSTCLNQHLLEKIYACNRTVSMYVSRLDLILLFRGYDIELFTELTFFL